MINKLKFFCFSIKNQNQLLIERNFLQSTKVIFSTKLPFLEPETPNHLSPEYIVFFFMSNNKNLISFA